MIVLMEKGNDGVIQDMIAAFLVKIRRIASIEDAADLTAPTMILDAGAQRVGIGADPNRTRIVATTENDDGLLPRRHHQHQPATVMTAVEIDRNEVGPLLFADESSR
jgi:hypothetical protein